MFGEDFLIPFESSVSVVLIYRKACPLNNVFGQIQPSAMTVNLEENAKIARRNFHLCQGCRTAFLVFLGPLLDKM